MVKISFLGGVGEFGKNITLYESEKQCLIVDCGMMFPENDALGIDRVIPDFGYIKAISEKKELALLITHSHEDHIGAVPFLLEQVEMPVYASPFAIGLLENKLEEMEIKGVKFIDITKERYFRFGSFNVEPIFVTHSIPESYSMAISTNDGIFYHSSDFKFDQTPLDSKLTNFSSIQEIGERGVTSLLIDSTNSEVPGIVTSEKMVFKTFEKYISFFENRLILTLFSTNIQRIRGILELCKKYNKKVAFLGRSLYKNIEVAEKLKHLTLYENVVINSDDIEKYDPSKVVVIATGSQGEPFSALSRIAFDEMKSISIEEKDLVLFSARIIPGNEKRIGRIINQVYRKGGRVLTPEDEPSIHASGHAGKEEIKMLASFVRAKYYIPIHGEFRQLKENGEIARELGYFKENTIITDVGDSLIFKEGALVGRDKVQAGNVLLDGESYDPVGQILLRERKHLANEGFVLPIVVVNALDGTFEAEPEIIHRGYPPLENQLDLLEEIKSNLKNLEKELSKAEIKDQNILKAKVKSTVKKSLKKRDSKIPLVIPVVMEV